ncbi:hypothetical protein NDI85_19980 [Halomicroarcula sp. S1AR25-4]|uniref:hypothetical protein n=1 Tax=Haloarcula sp. S1AR25-4 TaxID=2950538 RepID=UPI002874C796|nr:hypothetical protein [Halomicroarcula sp. S1AR25-4]MDS0280068.1 hypothetical protein [Halomicroarcula sp. S1AR25-4]
MTGADEWLGEHFEEIDASTFTEWMACPRCKVRTVTLRRDTRNGEVSLRCSECGRRDILVWGAAEDDDPVPGPDAGDAS